MPVSNGAVRAGAFLFMESKDPEIRLEGLQKLARLEPEQLPAVITTALDDADELVRIEAAELAGEYRIRQSAAKLHELLKRDTKPLVRRDAAIALGQLDIKRSIPVLEERLREARAPERVGLYFALCRLAKSKYLLEFADGLFNKSYRVRCATANLFPRLVNEHNRAAVARLLRFALEREKTVAARSSISNALKEARAQDQPHA